MTSFDFTTYFDSLQIVLGADIGFNDACREMHAQARIIAEAAVLVPHPYATGHLQYDTEAWINNNLFTIILHKRSV